MQSDTANKPQTVTDASKPKSRVFCNYGTSYYIGCLLLFNIPVIGWIACIIMAFAAQNQNTRNLARATLVLIVCLIIIGYAVLNIAFRVLEEYIAASDSVSDSTWKLYYTFHYVIGMKFSDIVYLLKTYY